MQGKKDSSYQDPKFLISIYRYMQSYLEKKQRYPTNREMVEAGFATSTSVIRYYYKKMGELGMLERDFGVSRGVRLLPLIKADPLIVKILEEELSEYDE